MMKKSMATKTSLTPHNHFTPIEEGNEDEEHSEERKSSIAKRDIENNRENQKVQKHEVSWNECRPSNREKNSVIPLSISSPRSIMKSVLSSLAPKLSPRPPTEEHWKIAVTELSSKLVQATRKRDEAILESSKLKYSIAELEKKLNKLEIYFKSGLIDVPTTDKLIKVGGRERVIEHFMVSVSEARSTVRILARALSLQLRHAGGKIHDRISVLLQAYDVKISFSRTPRGLLFFVEALLSKALFEDFECVGFRRGGMNKILNPIDHCESNFAVFTRLQGLTWEEVLNKGTRHFSEDFSRFCDRKMSDIMGMLGWDRAWPERLLQAFFGASKSVWLVHLLANSVHPGLPIFRVENGVGFDSVYMEDMAGEMKAGSRRLVPSVVRIMVTPGFYVFDSVVKCKVLCRYYNNHIGNVWVNDEFYDKGFTTSSTPLRK